MAPIPISELIEHVKMASLSNTPFNEHIVNDKTLHSILYKERNSPLLLADARHIVMELTSFAESIITNSLHLDSKMRDSWEFYNNALAISAMDVVPANTSKIIHKGRKVQKDWKLYALERLEEISKLITEKDVSEHSLSIMPFTTQMPARNIKLLHAKDLLILFKLIHQKYPNLQFKGVINFKFDDIIISTKCLEVIEKENKDAYDFLMAYS